MLALIFLFGEFILFALAVYFLFYIPGKSAFHLFKVKLTYPTDYFVYIVVGTILFTLTHYLLAWISLSLLIYPILLLAFFYARKNRLLLLQTIPKPHRKSSAMVVVMAVIFSFTMIFNGNFGDQIYHFGDDMAHLGYIAELRNAFPPEHPGFAGVPLKGYHFFSDYLIAITSNTTGISHLSIYFHFMPMLVALGWAFGTYALLMLWTKKIHTALWGVFLMLFGSSFSYILLIIKHPNANLYSNFGIDQPTTALLNAPFALSFIFMLFALICYQLYFQKQSKGVILALSLAVGIAPMFKVYAGILIISSFAVFTLSQLFQKRFEVLAGAMLSFIVFALTFIVFAGSGAHLFYLPLWPIERMFDGIFPEYNYKEKIETYTKFGVIRGLIETHAYTFFVFIVGNLGTRIIGILLLFAFFRKKLPSLFSLLLLSMISVSIILPLFFAQTIKVFDMIQMTWYFPLLVSIPAAAGIGKFMSHSIPRVVKIVMAITIILLTIPLSISYLSTKSLAILTVERDSMKSEYFRAMNFLKTQGDYSQTVLELPLGQQYIDPNNVKKWFDSTSPHIAAFGNKRSYLGNQFIVFPNMPLYERLEFLTQLNEIEQDKLQNTKTIDRAVAAIKNRDIHYIYTVKRLNNLTSTGKITLIHNQGEHFIYKVD